MFVSGCIWPGSPQVASSAHQSSAKRHAAGIGTPRAQNVLAKLLWQYVSSVGRPSLSAKISSHSIGTLRHCRNSQIGKTTLVPASQTPGNIIGRKAALSVKGHQVASCIACADMVYYCIFALAHPTIKHYPAQYRAPWSQWYCHVRLKAGDNIRYCWWRSGSNSNFFWRQQRPHFWGWKCHLAKIPYLVLGCNRSSRRCLLRSCLVFYDRPGIVVGIKWGRNFLPKHLGNHIGNGRNTHVFAKPI